MNSRSKNSASGTTKRLPDRFKRNPRFRAASDADWAYLWAGYQMGMWSDIFDDDMDKDEFQAQLLTWFGAVDKEWIFEAEHDGKLRPVGVVLGWFRPGGRAMEPHMSWFPWATTRVKYECLVHFLLNIRKEYKVFVYAPTDEEPFWKRLCGPRVLSRVGIISDYFAPEQSAIEYCTKGPFV